MYNNAAYDFGALEKKRNKKSKNIVKLPSRKARLRKKAQAKRMVVIGLLFSSIILGGVVSAFVMGQVQLTELTDQATTASKKLKETESIHTQLNMKLKTIENELSNQSFNSKAKLPNIEIVEIHQGDAAKIN